MPLPEFTLVRLTTDRYQKEGVSRGDIGVILEIYDDKAYEVEFSREDTGETIALLAIPQDEVQMVTPAETFAASRARG